MSKAIEDARSLIEIRLAEIEDDGLVVIEAKTSKYFRECFDPGRELRAGDSGVYRGLGGDNVIWKASVAGGRATTQIIRRRYHRASEIRGALVEAGLLPIAVLGLGESAGEINFSSGCDESQSQEIIHVARRAPWLKASFALPGAA